MWLNVPFPNASTLAGRTANPNTGPRSASAPRFLVGEPAVAHAERPAAVPLVGPCAGESPQRGGVGHAHGLTLDETSNPSSQPVCRCQRRRAGRRRGCGPSAPRARWRSAARRRATPRPAGSRAGGRRPARSRSSTAAPFQGALRVRPRHRRRVGIAEPFVELRCHRITTPRRRPRGPWRPRRARRTPRRCRPSPRTGSRRAR